MACDFSAGPPGTSPITLRSEPSSAIIMPTPQWSSGMGCGVRCTTDAAAAALA